MPERVYNTIMFLVFVIAGMSAGCYIMLVVIVDILHQILARMPK